MTGEEVVGGGQAPLPLMAFQRVAGYDGQKEAARAKWRRENQREKTVTPHRLHLLRTTYAA